MRRDVHRATRERARAGACGALALGALVAAFACEPEATVEAPAEPPEATPSAAPAVELEAPAEVEHELAFGETLWDLSKAYDVPLSTILEANELTERRARRLAPGTVLRIPGAREVIHPDREAASEGADDASDGSDGSAPLPGVAERALPAGERPELDDAAYHELAPGETLWDLARIYDKALDDILARNGYTDDDVRSLRAGQAVIVPGIRASDVRHETPSTEAPAQRSRGRRGRGVDHRLRSGETVWDLARRYQVSVAELMSANGLGPREVSSLQEGARIFIPGVTETDRVHTRRYTPAQLRDRDRARRLGLGTRQAAGDLLRGQVQPRWLTAAGGSRFPGTLRWPVTNGRYVRGFGSGEGGYHLAVDIAGDIGWNVRAAAPGIVGYAGDEVRGYGNIVIVVHPGGWVTMYAHNSVVFVVAGQRVRTGSVLAELGSTGISRGPHVHFELMYGGKNCDPVHLFRPGVRHMHRMARIEPLTWTRAGDRPDAIQCFPRRRHPHSRWIVNE